jgi:hypothetical protein
MNRYNKDAYFSSSLDSLLKIKDKKDFIVKARKLENYVIEKRNPLLAFRLSIELDDMGFRTARLENFIINSFNARLILRFAREIKKANIKKLQKAIIKTGTTLQIAKFGCFVRGAEKSLIENIIVESDHPKSAYLYLKFVKSCNLNKLKHIIIRSKKPRYLFALARLTKNKRDIELIQNLIIESPSNTYVRLFAVHIKGADIRRLEERIIQTKNVEEMKKFAKVIESPRLSKLALLF